jgi:hypothetical protein
MVAVDNMSISRTDPFPTKKSPNPPDLAFKALLQFVAARHEDQIRIFGSWKADRELQSAVENPLLAILELYPANPRDFVPQSKLDKDTDLLLFELQFFLEKLSCDDSRGLWFENGLKKRIEWALARRLAHLALERIGWEIHPPSLSQDTWRYLLID